MPISNAGGIAALDSAPLGGIAKPDRGVAGPSTVEPAAGKGEPGAGLAAERPMAGSAKPDGGVKSVGDTNSGDAAVPVAGGGIACDGVEPPTGEPVDTPNGGAPNGGAPNGTDVAGLDENPIGGIPNGAGVSPVIGDLAGLCAAKPVGGVGSGVACGLRPAKPEPGNAAPGKPAGAASGVLCRVGVGN